MVGAKFMIKVVQSVLDAVLVVLVGTQQANLCANDLQLGVAEFWTMQLTHDPFHLTPLWTHNFHEQIQRSVMVMVMMVVVVMMMVRTMVMIVMTCLVTVVMTVGSIKSPSK
jgi:hypothetical protein